MCGIAWDAGANWKQALEFKDAMAAAPVKEVSPSFLAANRMQLQEALEHAEQSRNIFSSFIFDATGWFHQIKLAPAMTAALLILGFVGGVGTTYKMMEDKKAPITSSGSGGRLKFRLPKRTLAQSNPLHRRQIPTRCRSNTTRCSRRY